MADGKITWIKITVDMFDNRKIRHIRKLPEGNNIVLIWVMLLTMAGRCNDNGRIYLTENIPYTPKMLADELDFEENTVRLALEALERLNMIASADGNLAIAGWEEYQNTEGMDRVREQTRKRVADHRERKRLSERCESENDEREQSVTLRNVTVTQNVALRNADVTQQNKKENKKENIRLYPPRSNDTEKGNDRSYRAGASENDDFEEVNGDASGSGGACGSGKAESGRTGSPAGERAATGEDRVRGKNQTDKPPDWRDLSKPDGPLY